MTQQNEIYGYQQAPIAELETAFSNVLQNAMLDLSFIHPDMPICACGLQLFEGQWVGVMLTPWMMSAVILPGPDQVWPARGVGERLGLKLPFADLTFTVGRVDGLPQYLASSLMSPLDPKLNAAQGRKLAEDCAKMLLSLPVADPQAAGALSRRALFTGLREQHDA